MKSNLAAAITNAASKQTYYTIRLLVDSHRREDAYRAYAYFRWLDDALDSDGRSTSQRMRLLERQKRLLRQCLRGDRPSDANPQERMLVELTQRADMSNGSLRAYLHNMMQVMEFDVARRGKLISQAELNDYTRWLAIAVTEAVDYFIGRGVCAPPDHNKYMAASAAHVMHMLRDTRDDVKVGYYNIPREVLEANSIAPDDVDTDAYRAWVKSRVLLARAHFDAGRTYLSQVQHVRYRLAGYAYMARFEWLADRLEKEDFKLRAEYAERHSIGTGLRMARVALSGTLNVPATSRPIAELLRAQP